MNPCWPRGLSPLFLDFAKRPLVLGLPRLKGKLRFALRTLDAALTGGLLDFPRPARPVLGERLGHAGNTERELGLLVRCERNSKFVCQRRAEIGAEHFFGGEQRSGVDRAKAPISPLCRVERKAMSMQLRVLPTRLSMNKCSDQQIDFLPLVAALPASRVAEVIA